MQTSYGELKVTKEDIQNYKKTTINMIYKLLPVREEGGDWLKYLESVILEIYGFSKVFIEEDATATIKLISKLSGLISLKDDDDFQAYRKIVFECTNLVKIEAVR